MSYIHSHYSLQINGNFISTSATLSVKNPLTEEDVGTVSVAGETETLKAIHAAHTALQTWRKTPLNKRCEFVLALSNTMKAHEEDLGRLLTKEQGKPLAEAIGEIRYAASFLESAAEEAHYLKSELIDDPTKRREVIRQPFGVVACITPWNFPAAMLTRKLGPALVCGNTLVIKPSELTPLSAMALGLISHDIGFPPGVINIINGDAKQISDILLAAPEVRKLSFTGSTPVGQSILKRSSQHITALSLELGGHAPFIVFDDADIPQTVQAAMACKYRNMGQTCICANRFFIHHSILDSFLSAFKDAVSKLTLGNGLEKDITIGPLIHHTALKKVEAHVSDALSKGAKLELGGKAVTDITYPKAPFFEPTILTQCNPTMALFNEETFGPVSGIMAFDTENEVLEQANHTPYGLAAYFFTKDTSRITRMSAGLDYGIIGVNDGAPSCAKAPFGGMKASGLGREGGRYVLECYSEIKYVCLEP